MTLRCRGRAKNAALIVARKDFVRLIVAARQSAAILAGVAYEAGRPGPRFRSMAEMPNSAGRTRIDLRLKVGF